MSGVALPTLLFALTCTVLYQAQVSVAFQDWAMRGGCPGLCALLPGSSPCVRCTLGVSPPREEKRMSMYRTPESERDMRLINAINLPFEIASRGCIDCIVTTHGARRVEAVPYGKRDRAPAGSRFLGLPMVYKNGRGGAGGRRRAFLAAPASLAPDGLMVMMGSGIGKRGTPRGFVRQCRAVCRNGGAARETQCRRCLAVLNRDTYRKLHAKSNFLSH